MNKNSLPSTTTTSDKLNDYSTKALLYPIQFVVDIGFLNACSTHR